MRSSQIGLIPYVARLLISFTLPAKTPNDDAEKRRWGAWPVEEAVSERTSSLKWSP
jgi:hypothetical protein